MDEKIKILIVDDNVNDCMILKKILEAKGYQIFTAYNHKEAIRLIGDEHPDLILLDLILNEPMDGVDFYKYIHIAIPDIPVILVTGHGAEEKDTLIPKAWYEGVIDEFLRKPVPPEDLIRAIEKHVRRQKDA